MNESTPDPGPGLFFTPALLHYCKLFHSKKTSLCKHSQKIKKRAPKYRKMTVLFNIMLNNRQIMIYNIC